MAIHSKIPTLFVATVVITCGDKIMLIYNPLWNSYTLPMTKLRPEEKWLDAAIRVACEYTGKLFWCDVSADLATPIKTLETVWLAPRGLFRTGEVRQSDRDGITKIYLFHVFSLDLDQEIELPCGCRAVWLTADEIQNSNLSSISGSARDMVRRIMNVAQEQHKSFPDKTIKWPYLRSSIGALAVIHRNLGGQRKWLVQWNKKWKRYNLVGGHKEGGESFRECMIREIEEELNLKKDGNEYVLSDGAGVPIEYDTWSESAHADTSYTFEIFMVTLLSASIDMVDANQENRWVSEAEIRAHCCADGKPLSDTVEKILDKVGWV